MEKEHLEKQYNSLCNQLKSEMNSQGFWSGRLSSSALATSVSIVTFKLNDGTSHTQRIEKGLAWIYSNINKDGGFGDSPESESNVSTTLLSYAAIVFCKTEQVQSTIAISSIENYLKNQKISPQSSEIANSVLDFYGKDLTFSVPILSMLSICGILKSDGLKKIPQLPFEFSLLPQHFYQLFNLQVVSYAIPALIAVGIYLFKTKKSNNPVAKLIRNRSILPALKKLESIMPESGGFLEAIPLTAFTNMCLMDVGFKDNNVVKKGISYLENQQRTDGSWPIDTDLSTWVTTLSVKAMASNITNVLEPESVQILKNHLLTIQYKEKHPFNNALAGGWGWTNYSGSVPDADDTPGAILALLGMYEGNAEESVAILQGCVWLLKLQNSDGGIPTFCKGWGSLPFDSSCADLTGHCILAWVKALDLLGGAVPNAINKEISIGIKKATKYLKRNQNPEGSWLPLWFGSQLTTDKHNPVYGTSRVGAYIQDCLNCNNLELNHKENLANMLSKAQLYLKNQQNINGSWGAVKGAEGTIEETALAISAVASFDLEAALNGQKWIENQIAINGLKTSPIGLYFASLWYDEKLYPLVFYIDALRRLLDMF